MTNTSEKNLNDRAQQEEITMNLEKIKELQQEVEQKMIDGIYHSKIFNFLTEKGLEGKAVKVKVELDLNQIRNEDLIKDIELKDSLRGLPGQEVVLTCCYPCNGGAWCSC